MGMVFQSYALFPHMTVQANIEVWAEMPSPGTSRRRTQRIDEVLDLVGLAAMADRYPRQLSGGQQQRVALRTGNGATPTPAVVRRAAFRSRC